MWKARWRNKRKEKRYLVISDDVDVGTRVDVIEGESDGRWIINYFDCY